MKRMCIFFSFLFFLLLLLLLFSIGKGKQPESVLRNDGRKNEYKKCTHFPHGSRITMASRSTACSGRCYT